MQIIGKWQGLDVIELPDEIFKGPLILPSRFIKYLEKLEQYKREYFIQSINDIFGGQF